jgi:dihydropteroate synthase
MAEASRVQSVRAARSPVVAPGWPPHTRPYPAVMGVLNITPDSFSDGGQFLAPSDALAQAERMIAEGADIIDVGAESTRPYGGQKPVAAADEIARLRPVLKDLVALGTPVSIDTMKADVARFALDAGASILNDVWGLQREPDMALVAAEYGVPVVAMHNREAIDPAIDIMADVTRYLERTLAIAAEAGIGRDRIALDPGVGFGKNAEQSMTVLARLGELKSFGCALLVGASRKRFISSVVASEPHQRLGGTLAAHLVAARNGATIIRAHDVAETVQALRVNAAIEGVR